MQAVVQEHTRVENFVIKMSNMSAADEGTSTRVHKHLGFIDTSIARLVDGSCDLLETGLREAEQLVGERYRPYAEKIGRQTSHHARKAAHTTKEGTTTMLQKLDPVVICGHLKS